MRPWMPVLGVGLLLLTGCHSDVPYRENRRWSTPAVYTTADTRLVTQRPSPNPFRSGQQILCTEPSPDVAKALSTASQLSANGGNGAVTAGVTASNASAEAVAELAGRSTALLGLRDGLYRICEAYANGAVGDAAYALVLSRYGQLMATLFLGQDTEGAGAASALASAQSPVLLGTGGSGGNQQQGATPKQGTTAKQNTPAPALAPAPAPAAPNPGISGSINARPSLVQTVAWLPITSAQAGGHAGPANNQPPAPGGAAGGGGVPGGAAGEGIAPGGTAGGAHAPGGVAGGGNRPQPATNTPSSKTSSSSPASTTGAPAALEDMLKTFFGLDTDLLHLLTVVCINETDPTRPATWIVEQGPNGPTAQPAPGNPFLVGQDGVCPKLAKAISAKFPDILAAQLAALRASSTPASAVHH